MDLGAAEQLALLALDDEGRVLNRAGTGLDPALAGALLHDLLRLGSVEIDDGTVSATSTVPDGGAVLATAWQSVREEDKARDLGWWLRRSRKLVEKLPEPVYDDLARRGVLSPGERGGLLRRTRHEILDPDARAAVVAHLGDVLDGGAPDGSALVVLGVLDPCELTTAVFPDRSRRKVTKQVKGLLEADDVADDIATRVARQVAATIAAIVAATVAASSSAGS